jgi:hypothetical protein
MNMESLNTALSLETKCSFSFFTTEPFLDPLRRIWLALRFSILYLRSPWSMKNIVSSLLEASNFESLKALLRTELLRSSLGNTRPLVFWVTLNCEGDVAYTDCL